MPQPMGWVGGHPGGGQPSGGGGPPNLGLLVDGKGNLEEVEEEDDDSNMPGLQEWNEEIGAYDYPDSDNEEDEEEEGEQGGGDPPVVWSSTRGNRGVPPTRYHDVFELDADIMSPLTVAMALDGEKGAEWAAAMEAKLDSLWENEVDEEVPRPSGKVIGTKRVLRIKIDAASNLDKFKARVVAKGFKKVEGLDYEETFAPSVRFESVKA